MEEANARILLEKRHDLILTGVTDVSGFSEDLVEVETVLGSLQVTGRGLHMDLLDLERGEVHLSGNVDSLWYPDEDASRKKGVFSRLFSK